jgi:UDP-glucose 4,6-dehydratase
LCRYVSDPVPFIRNNVESTISLLEYTRGLIRSGCDLKAGRCVQSESSYAP